MRYSFWTNGMTSSDQKFGVAIRAAAAELWRLVGVYS